MFYMLGIDPRIMLVKPCNTELYPILKLFTTSTTTTIATLLLLLLLWCLNSGPHAKALPPKPQISFEIHGVA